MNKNILLVDFGNSFIKAAIYDGYHDKIIETEQIEKTIDPRPLLSKFRKLSDHMPSLIIEAASARSSYSIPFNKELSKLLKCEVKSVGQFDYQGLIDFSTIDSNVSIGPDILACGYYLTKHMPKGSAIFSFGTVYFGVFMKDGKPSNCLFVPSLVKGLQLVSQDTTIVKDWIPKTFDKEVGLTTFDAFSAGANLIMEGFINESVKRSGIDPKNVIITGGDAFKFANINKKYKRIDNLILLSLCELAREKGWNK